MPKIKDKTGWTHNIKRTSVCSAHCANGKKCKRRTARGDVCFMHLRAQGLQIKKSDIPEAGLGLFSTIPREKNDYLTDYKGIRTTAASGDLSMTPGVIEKIMRGFQLLITIQ